MTIQEFQELVRQTNAKDFRHHHGSPEHNLQVRCVNWFRDNYPEFTDLFWSTPNGGYRSAKTAKEMKAEGQLAGVPDLQLALPNGEYHGLFIEMKKSNVGKKGQIVGKGKTSDRQDVVINALRVAGYNVEICYTYEQFQDIITSYINCKI